MKGLIVTTVGMTSTLAQADPADPATDVPYFISAALGIPDRDGNGSIYIQIVTGNG